MWVPTQEMRYLCNPCVLSSQTKPEGCGESLINKLIENGADRGCGWEEKGHNVIICLSRAHSSAAELSTPKSTQEMQGNFTHAQARQDQSLRLCAGNGVRYSSFTFCFSKVSSIHCTTFTPREGIRKSSYPIVCSGWKRCSGCRVMPWGPYLTTFA